MNLFDGEITYGIPLINTFIGNQSEKRQGQLNMDGYRSPINSYDIKNDLH